MKKEFKNELYEISNLITDMALKGATRDEIAKAVKHSMDIVDAEKHQTDYKQSEVDNDIAYLKKKYQNVIVHNPEELDSGIIEKAIEMMEEEEGRKVVEITVVRAGTEDKDEYKITPVYQRVLFKRLRRITGYLGDSSRWNEAKKAELEDRVSHGV